MLVYTQIELHQGLVFKAGLGLKHFGRLRVTRAEVLVLVGTGMVSGLKQIQIRVIRKG